MINFMIFSSIVEFAVFLSDEFLFSRYAALLMDIIKPATSIVIVGTMSLVKIRRNSLPCTAQLGIPENCRAIKELVV